MTFGGGEPCIRSLFIEEFAKMMSGKSDIWYATNMEIYDYLTAIRALEYSADESKVHNPSAISVWYEHNGQICKIGSGETKAIKD